MVHLMALWSAVYACHQLATRTTFVVKISPEKTPMARDEAYLPPDAPRERVGIKCTFHDWLPIAGVIQGEDYYHMVQSPLSAGIWLLASEGDSLTGPTCGVQHRVLWSGHCFQVMP